MTVIVELETRGPFLLLKLPEIQILGSPNRPKALKRLPSFQECFPGEIPSLMLIAHHSAETQSQRLLRAMA
jgi:hypothetical protein